MRQTLIPFLTATILVAQPIAAQEGVVEFDPILLTRVLAAAPGQTRLTPEGPSAGAGLDRQLREVAGVTTQGGTLAEPETAINIRGLQDHGRVAVTVDGMRQNFARSGHGANGSFTLDPDMLREVTVTRGPGQAAGAIAGAVALRMVSAEDLLQDDAPQGGELRLRGGTLTAAPSLHAAWAWQWENGLDLMLAGTRFETEQTYRAGNGENVHAGQLGRSGLARIGWDLGDEAGRLQLSAGRQDRDYITGRSAGMPRDTDLTTRNLALDYRRDAGDWPMEATLYRSTTRLAQASLDPTTLLPTGATRSYTTETTGLRLQASHMAEAFGLLHDLTLGVEAFRDVVTPEDAGGRSLTAGGTRTLWSLSVADRLELERATVTASLAVGQFRVSSPDGGGSGAVVAPRLALELPLSDRFTLLAAAGFGHRPPSLNEALVNGQHPEPADFDVRPNPNLRPEKARSAEIGLRYAVEGAFAADDSLTITATAFRNDVRDYIGMTRVGGVFNGYMQYQNIGHVRIEGVELEARYDSDRLFATLTGQHLNGTDLATGAELSRVAPDRLVLTGGWRSADHAREIGVRLTMVGAKTSGDFQSGNWKTLDLFLTQDVGRSAEFTLSLNNLFDETYTPHLELQPAPGFNAEAQLSLRF